MSDFKIVSLLNPGGVVFNSGIIAASILGNTAGVAALVSTGTLYLAGGNNITLSQNGQSITISGGAGGAGSFNISAGTTSNNLTNLVFSNSNNVSFGLNGSTITATVTVASTQASVNFSAGTTSNLRSNIVFSNSNGLAFGLDNGTITGSYTVPVVPSIATQVYDVGSAGSTGTVTRYAPEDHVHAGVVRIYAGSNTGNTLGNTDGRHGNWVIAGTNNITISGSTGGAGIHTLWISGPAPGGGGITNINLSAGTTSQNLSNFVLSNSNNVSFGLNGSTITATVTVASTQGSINLSAGTTSNLASAFTFNNANGITFGLNASTITASHNGLTSQSNQALSANNGSFTFQTAAFVNSNGVSFLTTTGSAIIASHNGITSQSNQNITFFATGNTTQSSSGSINASSVIIRGSGIASVGVSNGSVIVDVPSGAPSPVNFSAGTTSNNLGSVVFSNSNGVSFGLNGSTITASVNAAGGGTTVSGYAPFSNGIMVVRGDMNQSLQLSPHVINAALQYDRLVVPIFYSQATNSTLTISRTVYWGWFTKNNSSLSLVFSGSGSYSINGSGTASSANNSGLRLVSFGQTTTVDPGNYVLGLLFRSSTAGNNATVSIVAKSEMNSTISGYIGSASNSSYGIYQGLGVWTSTTSGIPNSLAYSDIRGGVSGEFQRPPIFVFTSGSA